MYEMILPIKGKWFCMIQTGEKLEEYREMKQYYAVRLAKILGYFEKYPDMSKNECVDMMNKDLRRSESRIITVLFRNGYSTDSPCFERKCSIRIKTGKNEWGAADQVEYYTFSINK